MNVNQHTPMASPYGQPQPSFGQPGYAPLDGSYPAPYAPYNGPASAYQPGAPPQGKVQFVKKCGMSETSSSSGRLYFKHSEGYNLGVSYMPPAM